jgi:hypothetical protein
MDSILSLTGLKRGVQYPAKLNRIFAKNKPGLVNNLNIYDQKNVNVVLMKSFHPMKINQSFRKCMQMHG